MLSVRENYCPDQVTFSGAEPSHPTTIANLIAILKAFVSTNRSRSNIAVVDNTSTVMGFEKLNLYSIIKLVKLV